MSAPALKFAAFHPLALRPLAAFATAAARQQATHRSELLAMAFGAFMDVFARISIWKAVYAGREDMAGISLAEMITYALVGSTFLSSWDAALIVREIGAAIRSGQIGATLMRPVSFPGMLFAEQLGPRLLQFAVVCLPVIAILASVYGIQPPASPGHFLLFVAHVALSTTLLFLIAIFFGLLSFWVLEAHSLEWFMRGLTALLSGGLVPLWFFPPALGAFAHALPFAWITYYPMACYLGRADLFTSTLLFAAGVGWALVLGACIAVLWRLTTRRVTVQGG
ncbi:ABC transporter permease [Rhizobium rhizosphaerae]|nr:ABC-2 family transporter protein [Xaviernesmea rhizosphaerae]